jgi:hypothetical protein
MKQTAWRVILGAVLVIFGAMALLQNFTSIRFEGNLWGVFAALLLGAVGAGFLVTFVQNRLANWWAVIPGMTLAGLAVMILLGILGVKPDEILPAIFMGCIGASFLIIYFNDRAKWWALIPGGTVTSVALLILFANQGSWPAAILFSGMAVTFGLVALTAGPTEHPRTWAWWPAGVLAVLGVIVAGTAGSLEGLVWPILLIGAGLIMVAYTLVNKKA